MTFANILSEIYRRTNFAASPASDVVTRIKSFVNLTHRQLLGLPGLEKLRDDTITFASVSAQASYGLPPSIGRVKTIHDRTNDRRLVGKSLDWLRTVDPGLDSSGTPDYFIPLGIQAVAKQPSDASEIFVDSTSASDDNTKTAYIEAIRTGGYPVSLSVTMNGVTAVSLGSAYTDIIAVTKFYISAAAVGTVTLHEDASGGTELARIPIGQTFSRYWGVQLWPTPSAAVTYYVDHTRIIPDLVNDNDQPLLPEDFHWLLVEGALAKELQKKDDDRAKDAKDDYDKGVKALRYFVNCPPDYLPVMGRGGMGRISRLGGQYPADTVIG